MDIAISSMTELDSEEAVTVLVHAFMADPIFSHLFPRVSDRAGVFAAFFSALVAINRPLGYVYIARRGRALVATAVWRPPGARAAPVLSDIEKARLKNATHEIDVMHRPPRDKSNSCLPRRRAQ
jgi:hypothetical protein